MMHLSRVLACSERTYLTPFLIPAYKSLNYLFNSFSSHFIFARVTITLTLVLSFWEFVMLARVHQELNHTPLNPVEPCNSL